MQLNRSTDYAIQMLVYLAKNGQTLSSTKLAASLVLSPIRCKTLLDGGRRRTKNLYGVVKRTVPAGQVRQ